MMVTDHQGVRHIVEGQLVGAPALLLPPRRRLLLLDAAAGLPAHLLLRPDVEPDLGAEVGVGGGGFRVGLWRLLAPAGRGEGAPELAELRGEGGAPPPALWAHLGRGCRGQGLHIWYRVLGFARVVQCARACTFCTVY